MRGMSEQTLLTAAAAPGAVFAFQPSQRYPDPRIEVLDPSFAKYRIFSSTVEMLGSGMRWAEGPVWFGDGRYLLVSDIPNNRIMRYDEATGAWGVFRSPSNFANGLARDAQGRFPPASVNGRVEARLEAFALAAQRSGGNVEVLAAPMGMAMTDDRTALRWLLGTDPLFVHVHRDDLVAQAALREKTPPAKKHATQPLPLLRVNSALLDAFLSAFHADYRPSYRKEQAEDGWKRAVAWFKAHGVA